jgi:hypothetical protein
MPLQISASKMSPSSKIESPLSFVTIWLIKEKEI